MLERGSSEREKSSEPVPVESNDDEDETGASVNGDVEDNVDEAGLGGKFLKRAEFSGENHRCLKN
jgi:hypothetical protein